MDMWITKALERLRPGASWYLEGDEYAGLEWLDEEQPKPTAAEVAAEVALIQDEEQSVADARESALTKLMALGLTEAEALAIAGTPPSA